MILKILDSVHNNKKRAWLFIVCFSALGETCTASDPCTKDNSECRDDKCQCKTGYTEEEGGCKICNFKFHWNNHFYFMIITC
jgi:hypothetical protein